MIRFVSTISLGVLIAAATLAYVRINGAGAVEANAACVAKIVVLDEGYGVSPTETRLLCPTPP